MQYMKYFLKDFFKENLKANFFDIKWEKKQKSIEKSQNQLKRNIKNLGDFEDIAPSKLKSLKKIYNESQEYWRRHKTFKGMSQRQLRELLFILFSNPNDGVKQGVYENPEQFDDFLNILIQKNKQSVLKKLILELLYYYPKERNLLFQRLDKVYSALEKNKKRNQLLITANKKFKLIEKSGPKVIAWQILNSGKNIEELLPEVWIKERHLSQGIGESIVQELCYLVNDVNNLESETLLNRFLEYFDVSSSLSLQTDAVRYKDIKPIVSTLLLPFENKTPQPFVKKEITQFLDKHIGDPRFKSEKWIALPKEKSVFQKWKVSETIKDFFSLLDYTAKQNPDSDRMWPYRKEFIENYWDAGHIGEAWIVLGKEAYKNRLKFLKEDFNDYGTITRRANPIHSVLLFRINDLTLSEWNYNGSIRIWQEENKYKPVFYKKEYLRKTLVTKPDKDITHHYPEKYYWQKKLSHYIKKYTGLPCPENLRKKIDKVR